MVTTNKTKRCYIVVYAVSRVDKQCHVIVLDTTGTTYTFYRREKNLSKSKQMEKQKKRYGTFLV